MRFVPVVICTLSAMATFGGSGFGQSASVGVPGGARVTGPTTQGSGYGNSGPGTLSGGRHMPGMTNVKVPKVNWSGSPAAALNNPTTGAAVFIAPQATLAKAGIGGVAVHPKKPVYGSSATAFDYLKIAECIKKNKIQVAKFASDSGSMDQLERWGVKRTPALVYFANDGHILGVLSGRSFTVGNTFLCFNALPVRSKTPDPKKKMREAEKKKQKAKEEKEKAKKNAADKAKMQKAKRETAGQKEGKK